MGKESSLTIDFSASLTPSLAKKEAMEGSDLSYTDKSC